MPQLVGNGDLPHHHFIYLSNVDGAAYDGNGSEAVSCISSWSVETSQQRPVREQVDHSEHGFELDYYTLSGSTEGGSEEDDSEQMNAVQNISYTSNMLNITGTRWGCISSILVDCPALSTHSLQNLRRVWPISVPRLTAMSHLPNHRIHEEFRSPDLPTRAGLLKQRSTIRYLISTDQFGWCRTSGDSEDCDKMTRPWTPLLKLKFANKHTQIELRGGGSPDSLETNDHEPSSTRPNNRVDSVSNQDPHTKNTQTDLPTFIPTNAHNVSSPDPTSSQDTDRFQPNKQNTPTTSSSSQTPGPLILASASAEDDYTNTKRIYPKPATRKTVPGQSNFTERFDIAGPAHFQDFAAPLGVLPGPRQCPPRPKTGSTSGKEGQEERGSKWQGKVK